MSSWGACVQVPDLDAVLQTSDFPCMLGSGSEDSGQPPPVFGYNSHPTYTDVPFPDYSYWGHEYSHLLGAPPSLLLVHCRPRQLPH